MRKSERAVILTIIFKVWVMNNFFFYINIFSIMSVYEYYMLEKLAVCFKQHNAAKN